MTQAAFELSGGSVVHVHCLAYGAHWLGSSAMCTDASHRDWPQWTVLVGEATADASPDVVVIPLHGGAATMDRRHRTVHVHAEPPITAEVFLHPYLSGIGAVAAWWLNRIALHAGWFALDGRAVAVLGASNAGKSTLLAGLSSAGFAVGSDDLLVGSGSTVFAGPRVLDLREGAGEWFGGAPDHSLVAAGRVRWRTVLPACPPQADLAAVAVLTWGALVEVTDVPASERIPLLLQARSLQLADDRAGAQQVLELATLPMVRLSRPRRLADVRSAAAALVEGVRLRLDW